MNSEVDYVSLSASSKDLLVQPQQFDVAEKCRLKFPSQYSITPYEKLRLENIELEISNQNEHIAKIIDGKVTKALDHLKMIENERNQQILKDNYTRSLDAFRYRQKLLCEQNKVFRFKSNASAKSILVNRFSEESVEKVNESCHFISIDLTNSPSFAGL